MKDNKPFEANEDIIAMIDSSNPDEIILYLNLKHIYVLQGEAEEGGIDKIVLARGAEISVANMSADIEELLSGHSLLDAIKKE